MAMSPDVKKTIKDLVSEVSGAMTRMEGERDFIKEAIKEAVDKHELDKKILQKMCKTYHKQQFHTEKKDNEAFVDQYSEVFNIVDDYADES